MSTPRLRERAAPSVATAPLGSKRCSVCGKEFGCAGGEPGCWCESVLLRPETLSELRTVADDCLCASCLGGYARRDREAASEIAADATAGAAGATWAKAIPAAGVRARGPSGASWIAASLLLVTAMLVGLGVGPVSIGPGAIVTDALSHVSFLHVHSSLANVDDAILWQLRAPRVVLAALVGGMLAIAGSSYQGVFLNRLADPYLLGVAAGAGLGATLAIAYISVNGGGEVLPLAAFAGAVIGVAAAYFLGRSVGGVSNTGTLILAGVAVAAFLTAIQTFVQIQHPQSLRDVYAWLLGGFGSTGWHDVAIASPYIVVSSAILLAHRRLLDVLSLGDEEASSLGVEVRRVRMIVVVAATAGTAAAVAVSGLIGFVGIIVPHTIRLLVSTSYRAILPLSLLVGAAFLVLTDAIARTIVSPGELPVGVVTAFFGAPFFAVVLRTTRSVGP